MAFSSSFANSSVAQEQLKMFHNIDRILFTRLVVNLRRDPAESTHVMALWLWLEQVGQAPNLVYNLISTPINFVSSLADEAVLCLTCIEYDQFPVSLENSEIPWTQNLTKSGLSLQFFHENRLGVLRGVTRNVSEVCIRGFDDILQQTLERRTVNELVGVEQNFVRPHHIGNQYGPLKNPTMPPFYHHSYGVGFASEMGSTSAQTLGQGMNPRNIGVLPLGQGLNAKNMVVLPLGQGMNAKTEGILTGFSDPYELSHHRKILNNEIGDILSRLHINGEDDREDEPVDDRTIFLTFSKGYPISEDEVKEFFARSYGDCIEVFYMQEVVGDEQPLYARLVINCVSNMDIILGNKGRVKFSINGKHVWARKYVRKGKSPPQPSTPRSQQASASAPPTTSHN